MTPTPTPAPWYHQPSLVLALATHLDDAHHFATTTDLLYYFEKPWKYQDEWDEYQASRSVDVDPAPAP